MLEHLAGGWHDFKDSGNKLEDHKLILKNKKNIIFGHLANAGSTYDYEEYLDCVRELNTYRKIIMPMRDPLLTLISSIIRFQNKKEAKRGTSIAELGGPLAPMSVWLRKQNQRRTRTKRRGIARKRRVQPISQKKEKYKPPPQNISGSLNEDEEEVLDHNRPISYYLNQLGMTSKKGEVMGSEHIQTNHREIRGYLFMWELWAKHIHKLNPNYIFMDLPNTEENFDGVGFYDIGKHNVTKTYSLKAAYYNKDLLLIAKELRCSLKALMDMEPLLRPPLEELGYEDLLWWSPDVD
jgi:hypothetical protein